MADKLIIKYLIKYFEITLTASKSIRPTIKICTVSHYCYFAVWESHRSQRTTGCFTFCDTSTS